MKIIKINLRDAAAIAHFIEKWAYGHRNKNEKWITGLVDQENVEDVEAVESAINAIYAAEDDDPHVIEIELPERLAEKFEFFQNNGRLRQ